MTRRGKLALVLCCAGGSATLLSAQKVVSARAGLISYVQGSALVDGARIFLRTTRFTQMRDGETLSTTARGRVELLLAPGTVLRLGEDSQLRLEDSQLASTRITLQRGEALIEIVQLAEGNRIQVDLHGTTTEPTRPGLYQFGISQNGAQGFAASSTPKSTLRVYAGEALVRSGPGTVIVKRGTSVDLDTKANPDLMVTKFDRKQTDSLHGWSARRSFELFMSDADARLRQTHWQVFRGGYVENKNFGVTFRTAVRRTLPPVRQSIPSAENP